MLAVALGRVLVFVVLLFVGGGGVAYVCVFWTHLELFAVD